MAQIQFLDNLLKEYLIFRGFSNTLKALDVEQKNEKDQSFRAEKIMEQFNQSIQQHDLSGLLILWKHLDTHLFNKLEHIFVVAVKKLENSLLKLYLVTAYNHHKTDKITEFFNKLAPELQNQTEWKDWFFFPFCRNADEHPTFSLYFTKQWNDTFQLSLRNFLATVYQCLPQPTFVRAEQEANIIRHLQEENDSLRSRLKHVLQQQQNIQQNSTDSYGEEERNRSAYKTQLTLNDIHPFDINPPVQPADDFCIIAAEANSISQASDAQLRGLKMLIRNIGAGTTPGSGSGSPTMGRKDALIGNNDKTIKRRSGSVGRNWL